MDPDSQVGQTFARRLPSTFQYPFQGDGPYIIVTGGVIFTIADFVSAYASILGILIQLGVLGYLGAYAKAVTQTSAMGQEDPPGWTDCSDWWNDLVVPAFEFIFVTLLSFGALVFLAFKHPSGTSGTLLWLAAGAWGCLSLPIFFLAMAVTDSLLALLNPLPLLRAVWLTLPDYLLASLFCALIVGLSIGQATLEDWLSRIPILPHLLGWMLSIYLITVLMRCFGLLYCRHHDRLQWY